MWGRHSGVLIIILDQLLYGKITCYWPKPCKLISRLKPLRANFRSNQRRVKIRFADIYYVAKRLILVECGDVLKNPVMPVRLPQIWIDFHFTAYLSPSVESPATLFIHSNDNVPSSLTSSPKSIFSEVFVHQDFVFVI